MHWSPVLWNTGMPFSLASQNNAIICSTWYRTLQQASSLKARLQTILLPFSSSFHSTWHQNCCPVWLETSHWLGTPMSFKPPSTLHPFLCLSLRFICFPDASLQTWHCQCPSLKLCCTSSLELIIITPSSARLFNSVHITAPNPSVSILRSWC